ncbi:potassium channel family protein [Demequina sp. SYSU T00192]|uniref:Potassium channel family protein n=1 Tax=Demequina litoralis TaxID=3051660 RepID=A0ABT8G7F3_9MICO|nr:potassium channel family protein [Demequina sp. SYSU T00192]MDN4474604.1 potassium channel family protein [Demequina sp. SYSU T00192]
MANDAPSPQASESEAAAERPMLWFLLATLVVLQFGYPITFQGRGWTTVYLLVYIGVVAFSIRSANRNRRRRWPLFAASLVLVVTASWFAVRQDDAQATAAMLAGVGLLQLTLVVTLVASLVHPPERARTVDLLLLAVCAYLLLGGVFGALSGLLEHASPGSFIDPNAAAGTLTWQGLLYGSYVTLATLGFGDIVPVAPWARSLWSFEAVLGTLFVAVVIARLVGVAGFAARDTRDRPAS